MKKLVGNDIVDLAYAGLHNNWRRPGYLFKVFTEDEQKYINNSEHPDQSVWLLWSMKESAYKVFYQQYRKRMFNPLMIECGIYIHEECCCCGEVSITGNYYKTTSKYSEKIISTLAVSKVNNSMDKIISEVISLSSLEYKTQHFEIYDYVIKCLRQYTNETLSISKDAYGIPRVYENDVVLDLPISISHHGRLGAFAIAIE